MIIWKYFQRLWLKFTMKINIVFLNEYYSPIIKSVNVKIRNFLKIMLLKKIIFYFLNIFPVKHMLYTCILFFIKKFFYKWENYETNKLIIRMKQISLLFVSFVVFFLRFLFNRTKLLLLLIIIIVFSSSHV